MNLESKGRVSNLEPLKAEIIETIILNLKKSKFLKSYANLVSYLIRTNFREALISRLIFRDF